MTAGAWRVGSQICPGSTFEQLKVPWPLMKEELVTGKDPVERYSSLTSFAER